MQDFQCAPVPARDRIEMAVAHRSSISRIDGAVQLPGVASLRASETPIASRDHREISDMPNPHLQKMAGRSPASNGAPVKGDGQPSSPTRRSFSWRSMATASPVPRRSSRLPDQPRASATARLVALLRPGVLLSRCLRRPLSHSSTLDLGVVAGSGVAWLPSGCILGMRGNWTVGVGNCHCGGIRPIEWVPAPKCGKKDPPTSVDDAIRRI